MAKKKVRLTNEQIRRNEAILARIEEEKARLYSETRALQEEWNSKKRRRRRRKSAIISA